MKLKPRRSDWVESKLKNQAMIIGNKMQIMMAKQVIKLCDEQIARFPTPKPLKRKPLNKTSPL